MPLLAGANTVTILSVGTEKSSGRIGGEDLVKYLKCHGVATEHRVIAAGSWPVSEVISGFYSNFGSDLLCTGTFTYNRLSRSSWAASRAILTAMLLFRRR